MAGANRLVVAVIGAGKMAYDCIARIVVRERFDLSLLITRPDDDAAGRRLARQCAGHGIQRVCAEDPNADHVAAVLRQRRPEVVFNINSNAILGDRALSHAPGGIINFHNGPLPAYAGLNIPTWVIWNGEARHGVTWHFVTRDIDAGHILTQHTFAVPPAESAASLMFRCIDEGIRLFDPVLDQVASGERTGRPQTGRRTYYGAGDIPNDGVLDPGWDSATTSRFLRAFDYRPFPSPVGYPRLQTDAGLLYISRGRVAQDAPTEDTPPGTFRTTADRLLLRLPDGGLLTGMLVDQDGRPLPREKMAAFRRGGARRMTPRP